MEQLLYDAINRYNESPFSKAATLKWLGRLEDEVKYVDFLIKLAKERGLPLATKRSTFDGEKLKAGVRGTVHWMKDNFGRFFFFKIKFRDVCYEKIKGFK